MKGLDLLGIGNKHFDIKLVHAHFPKGAAIGFFDKEFGNSLRRVRSIFDRCDVGAARVHIFWSSAHRLVSLKLLRKRLPFYQKLALDYPHIPIYVSPSCEHIERNPAKLRMRFDLITELAPACIPVNSIGEVNGRRGIELEGIISEHHGDIGVKSGEIVSMDGTDITDINLSRWRRRNKNAFIRFYWCSEFNLRRKGVAPSRPPKQRTEGPSAEKFRQVVRVVK